MLTYRRPGDVVALLVRGLALFDLPPGSRKATPGWQERCTRGVDQVMAWMRAGHNLGVGCRASGVAVLDLDVHPFRPSGLLMFSDLCEHYGVEWPTTLTSVTPRGQHLFFRVPAGRVVLSRSGPRSPLGPGIDVRGPARKTGGYVVAAGSVVPGGEYRVLRDHPIADLPPWLVDAIAEPEEV